MKGPLRPDYKSFTPADFALDELFIKWVNGNDPGTDRFWREWLDANPSKRQDIEVARALVLSLRIREDRISETEIKAEWFRLQTREEHEDPLLVERSGSTVIEKLLRIAAIVVLAVASSFILNNLFSDEGPERLEFAEQRASKGQKLSVVLPDGTSILLNAGSTVRYPTTFGEDSREVDLVGEAFFDVVHDPARPFKVRTNDIITRVLGTSFNVKAYPEDSDIEVALIDGIVRIDGISDSTGSEVFLSPSEMITINKRSKIHRIHSFKPIEVVGWKDGILYFDRVSFPEAIARLERWYGVNIRVNPGVQLGTNWRFNGKFHGRTLKEILRVFSYPDLFKYRIDGDSVVIYSGGGKRRQQTE